MNKGERVAFDWLKVKHPEAQIVFNATSSPDFVVDGRIGYEVKRGHKDKVGNTHIVGSREQLNQISGRTELDEIYVLVVHDAQIQQIILNDLLEHGVPNKQIVPHWYEDKDGRTKHSLKIDPKLRDRAKIEAINRGIDLSDLVELALKKELNEK